jgi:hypothetical protein
MNLPPILQGESRVRLTQGAVFGALATAIVGFSWAGWTLGSTAEQMAERSASKAVVAALAPICVDKFQRTAEATATLAQLKATDTWQQDAFVVKGGWATFPGDKEPNREVAEACAKMLGELK